MAEGTIDPGMNLPASTYEGRMGIPLNTERGTQETTNLGGEASQIQQVQQGGIGSTYDAMIAKALDAYKASNPMGAALTGATGNLGSLSTQAGSMAGNVMPTGMQGPGAPAGSGFATANSFQNPNSITQSFQGTPSDFQSGVGSWAYNPYMQTGAAASQEAANLAGIGQNPMSSQDIYSRYLDNPAVAAQMNQGMQAINSNYGARGLTGSSAILKALNTFGQGVASQTIGQAQQNLFNLAGQGATAANQYASNLLQNYNTNINAQLQGQQNANSFLNTANQAALNQGQLAQGALTNQTSLMSQAAGNRASLATQASMARMNALSGAYTNTKTSKDTQGYALDMGGLAVAPFTGKGGGVGFDKKGAN